MMVRGEGKHPEFSGMFSVGSEEILIYQGTEHWESNVVLTVVQIETLQRHWIYPLPSSQICNARVAILHTKKNPPNKSEQTNANINH
jgi:hypothetical protein